MKALYLLAEQTERQGTGAGEGEVWTRSEKYRPYTRTTMTVLLEVARLAARPATLKCLRMPSLVFVSNPLRGR